MTRGKASGDFQRYDVHCHYFNITYAFREMVAIGWNATWGNYPHRSTRLTRFSAKRANLLENWSALVRYVARMSGALTRPCEGQWQYEQERYKTCFGNTASLITAPLMMDIYFMFDNGEDKSWRSFERGAIPAKGRATLDFVNVAKQQADQFREYALGLKQQVLLEIDKQQPMKRRGALPKRLAGAVDRALEQVIKEFIQEPERTGERRSAHTSMRGVELSPGYSTHLQDLIKLQNAHPESVFPFLAVDPRRLGILGLATDLLRKRKFSGVKLYPPLGYLPSHPALDPVLSFCENGGIPITTHCSPGGFPTLLNKVRVHSTDSSEPEYWIKTEAQSCPSEYFADPVKWEAVFRTHKTIKVNFAHFGGEQNVRAYAGSLSKGIPLSPKQNWTARIIGLMDRRENVFADLAFCPGSDIADCVETIVKNHPIVAERLMFGTDYIMIMLDKKAGELDAYFDKYRNLSEGLFEGNARRFVGAP